MGILNFFVQNKGDLHKALVPCFDGGWRVLPGAEDPDLQALQVADIDLAFGFQGDPFGLRGLFWFRARRLDGRRCYGGQPLRRLFFFFPPPGARVREAAEYAARGACRDGRADGLRFA